MSRSQRAGDTAVATGSGPPPASSSRYHRSSMRSQKGPGLGSSSTRVQVVGERGYDSEIPREMGGMASVSAGYHTEGQASTTTKRGSTELLRNVVDPRRNGRLSSMPSQHPSHTYTHEYHFRPELLDDPAADRGSSTRRVRKEKEKEKDRRHHDRDPTDPVPPSVWLNQVTAADAKRARRTSGSRTRHDDPQQFQHDPRAYPPSNQDHHRHPHYQSPPYGYANHQSNPPHRNGNPAPTRDYYRPDDLAPEYMPSTPQANNPRYAFVIDDRAGMHSPPPVEIPHPVQPPSTTPAAPLLPLPRSKEELLRSEGLAQGSPFTGHRRHRPGRSEDFGTNGAFTDATNHARTSLRHRPSHSEDLRKLGQGHPPEPEEPQQLARPFHVGRSASENVVPQIPATQTTQPQLATPGMYNTGLAVTPAAPRGFAMTPQLQESFAESANASRAPVNAAMASAAIANGTDSDSTRGEKERKRRTRRSKQVDAPTEGVSAADLQALQLAKEPTPPPTIQPLRRQRTVSGRSITAQPTPPPPPAISAEAERDEDMVVYQRPPEPVTFDSARTPQAPVTSPPIQARVDVFRMPGEQLPQGLAIFGSRPEMTSSGITPAGPRTEMTQVPGPRADLTNEISRGVETLRAAGEVAPAPVPLPAARRGSLLDEERTRKYSAATEGGASASGSGSRRPSGATDEQRRPVVRAEDQPHRRPSPNHAATAPRKSVASDASSDSFQSAQLGGSTMMDFQSARDAMSPMSNYHSIAPSMRSEPRDPRVAVAANEARETRNPDAGAIVQLGSRIVTAPTAGHRSVEAKRASGILPIGHASVVSPPAVAFPSTAHANVISPPPAPANVISPSISKERVLSRGTPVPATPLTSPKPVEPEVPMRPRVPSNNMLGSTPPEVPGQRATLDVHVPPPPVPVDEEGRLRGPPVASTMPARANRASLTARPGPPQTTAPTSPLQTHAQTQPEASAVPKNLHQTHQVEGSKESLPETLNSTKASRSKSSKWWKSSAPKAPSPTPTPAPPGTSQPRQRNTSMLGFLSSKHKRGPSETTLPQPPSQPQPNGNEMYSYESTPSSTTLDHDQDQPREKESRMARMVTAIKGGLRRTPSTSKMGHFPSKSISHLPRTGTAVPAGAPLARSASTNGREGVFASMFPMSPQRSKEPPLKPVAPPVEPPAIPPLIPAPVPIAAPTPTPAPPMTVPISVVASPANPAAVPTAPKPRPAEAAPGKGPVTKDVQIIEKGRVPISGGVPPSSTATKVTRTYVDGSGRSVDPAARAEKRSSTQAPPPHPQGPTSPPLVNRSVTPGRLPAGQTKIFTNDPPRTAPQAAPVPNTPHASQRKLSRSGGRITSRERVPSTPAAPNNQLRPTHPGGQPVPVHSVDPPAAGDLGLPTPDDTPRASPTGEEVFEGRAAALQEERERRQSQERRRHRQEHLVIPPTTYGGPNIDELNQRLHAGADPNAHGVIKFDHREKRAVSVASVEAVSGQEGHFRSETSSIRTSTPGPHQITFPNRDPAEATQSWAIHQTEEDIRAGPSRKSGRDGRKSSGVLKRNRGGVRKPGVAFDFPSGPIIEADEDPQESRQQADIHLTYELERRQKRYK
ncbi:unnamed protein product [Rhizoctonia solani]|uniref:Uncharacterized protein n=1 Tax=Rhizoctonia solani TaxID=456999 RepID=A0A8H3EGH7_9AGAM|nr:unnamed protein product [Rhizoctonia solani]